MCEYEGDYNQVTEDCYSSVEVYGVNPREPIGGKSSAEIGIGQALCVEQRNTAIEVSVCIAVPVQICCGSRYYDHRTSHASLIFGRRISTSITMLSARTYSIRMRGKRTSAMCRPYLTRCVSIYTHMVFTP